MPNTTTSQFMSLPIPIVGVDPGPQYGTDLNSCFTKIDQHNHSSGQGVTITPSGISITSDLPFNGNNARSLRTTTFSAQNSTITGSGSDLTCLYAVVNELYYNDGLGNPVKITSGGFVNAGAGSITGMTGSASVALAGGTFSFLNTSGNPAGISGSSFIMHANGNAITLEPNASLSANYNAIFPSALPGSQSFLTLDSSGNIAAAAAFVGGITNAQLAAVNIASSASSTGNFTSSSTSFVDVSNATLTITTIGRPVLITAVPDGTLAGFVGASYAGNSSDVAFAIVRDNTVIFQSVVQISITGATAVQIQSPCGGLTCVDTAANAAAHVYKLQTKVLTTGTSTVNGLILQATEL